MKSKRQIAALLSAALFILYPPIYLSVSTQISQKASLYYEISSTAIVEDKTNLGTKTYLFVRLTDENYKDVRCAVYYSDDFICDIYDVIEIEGDTIGFYDKNNRNFYMEDFDSIFTRETALSKGCAFALYANKIVNLGRIPKENQNLIHKYQFFIKDNLRKGFDIIGTTDTYAVASALLTGDRSFLSYETRDDFIRSGLIALLCISGLHIVISTAFIDRFMKFLRIKASVRTAFIIFFLAYAMTVTGFRGSVMRACIMSMIFYISKLFGKHRDPFSVLAVAFLIVAISNPFCIFDISTLLSFLAMLGFVFSSICGDSLFDDTHSLYYKVKKHIISSFYATCFAAVPIVEMFGGISVISPLSNLFVSVIFAPLMYLLIGCAFLCFLPTQIFSVLAFIPSLLIVLLEKSAHLFASIPFTYTSFLLPNFFVGAYLAFFAAFMFSVCFLKNRAVIVTGYSSFLLTSTTIFALFVLSYL